jgi:hypothetical protein
VVLKPTASLEVEVRPRAATRWIHDRGGRHRAGRKRRHEAGDGEDDEDGEEDDDD